MSLVRRGRATHEMTSQPPPLEGYNLFDQDVVLGEAVEREGGGWGTERLSEFGRVVGGEPLRLGEAADRHPPTLRTHDRYGNRLDEIEFHPAWTELLRLGIRAEIPSLPWRDPRPGAHAACDAFLVLAQAPGGLSCFLLPRILPDGSRNGFHIQRLKNKLGTRSLASSEVEFDAAIAWLVGEEGRGVSTIIDMVNHTRLDCVLGSAAGMRRAVAEATHHAAHRSAFGKRLIEQPLMTNVLADLCVESEAATVVAFRLARAFDPGAEPSFQRLATAVTK